MFILILILNVEELKDPVFVLLLVPLFSQKSADALVRQNVHIES